MFIYYFVHHICMLLHTRLLVASKIQKMVLLWPLLTSDSMSFLREGSCFTYSSFSSSLLIVFSVWEREGGKLISLYVDINKCVCNASIWMWHILPFYAGKYCLAYSSNGWKQMVRQFCSLTAFSTEEAAPCGVFSSIKQ